MSLRRLPIVPTLLVLAAAGYMIHLGLWQLDRLRQKEAMIARYTAAQADQTVHPWGAASVPYSRVSLTCANGSAPAAVAGQNAARQAGWAHLVVCDVMGGGRAEIVLGWSQRPEPVAWSGGAVTGTRIDRGQAGVRVVADPPLAGLQANARPDPRDLPNNHLSYAVQWFLFAGTALVIYGLAVRKRMRA
jgi:surfeit locus 1 family protein